MKHTDRRSIPFCREWNVTQRHWKSWSRKAVETWLRDPRTGLILWVEALATAECHSWHPCLSSRVVGPGRSQAILGMDSFDHLSKCTVDFLQSSHSEVRFQSGLHCFMAAHGQSPLKHTSRLVFLVVTCIVGQRFDWWETTKITWDSCIVLNCFFFKSLPSVNSVQIVGIFMVFSESQGTFNSERLRLHSRSDRVPLLGLNFNGDLHQHGVNESLDVNPKRKPGSVRKTPAIFFFKFQTWSFFWTWQTCVTCINLLDNNWTLILPEFFTWQVSEAWWYSDTCSCNATDKFLSSYVVIVISSTLLEERHLKPQKPELVHRTTERPPGENTMCVAEWHLRDHMATKIQQHFGMMLEEFSVDGNEWRDDSF